MRFRGYGSALLEPDMQIQKFAPHIPPHVEVVVQRQTRELAQQVVLVVIPIHRVVEDGVGVGEDVLRRDALSPDDLLEMPAELLPVVVVDALQAPLGDVGYALAVLGVAVEGEAECESESFIP